MHETTRRTNVKENKTGTQFGNCFKNHSRCPYLVHSGTAILSNSELTLWETFNVGQYVYITSTMDKLTNIFPKWKVDIFEN